VTKLENNIGCQMDFSKGMLSLEYRDEQLQFKYRQEGSTKQELCFKLTTPYLKFPGYLFIAAYSGVADGGSAHLIKTIKTYNTDEITKEGEEG
jgi:hypothetical protein